MIDTVIEIVAEEAMNKTEHVYPEETVKNFVINRMKQQIIETYHKKILPIFQEALRQYTDATLLTVSESQVPNEESKRDISRAMDNHVFGIAAELLEFGRGLSGEVAKHLLKDEFVER